MIYERYCHFCGNNKVVLPDGADRKDHPCGACRAIISDLGGNAWAAYHEALSQYGHCCSGLDGRHIYLHSDDFSSSYGKAPLATFVEAGIRFHKGGADCYWIFDNDSTCQGEDLGEVVPYEDPEFWKKIKATLDTGAEVAWSRDVLSCQSCGYHFMCSYGEHCCE